MKYICIFFSFLFVLVSTLENNIRTITSVEDFTEFANNVTSGITTYEGTTLYLDNDINFNGKTLDPIGNYSNFFLGTFDGQGHIISDLVINSSLQYVGLFGYSEGLSIKNIVINEPCSVTSSHISSSSGHAYVGGIIGYCTSSRGACTIENVVNMGSVTFKGTLSSSSLFIGGIAGYLLSSSSIEPIMKNCANYGSVSNSGTGMYLHIGGFIGRSYGSSMSKKVHIKNCLNYGSITHSGTSNAELYIGGIGGVGYYTSIENCMSAGIITNSGPNNYVGSIVGYTTSTTSITNSFWTGDVGYDKSYGDGNPNVNGTKNVVIDNEVLEKLNSYSASNSLSKWAMLCMNGGNINKINQEFLVINNKQFPDPEKEGYTFEGWFKDSEFTNKYDPQIEDTVIDVYAKFTMLNFTITFDTKGEVLINPITVPFNSIVVLQSNLTKVNYSFFWLDENGEKVSFDFVVPARNVTLTATWVYTRITSVDEFIEFSTTVNSGTGYKGITAFLYSDIDFNGKTIDVIGQNATNCFRGTFDGQGHIISNLVINSFSEYVGLFGYSEGLTIKNVVLDETCSIVSSYSTSSSGVAGSIGGILGYFIANAGTCTIENVVNMGSVTFNGTLSSSSLYLGGIVGYLLSSSKYGSIVENCVNYGSVSNSGTGMYLHIGGFIGRSGTPTLSSPKPTYIQNCLNYGAITHNGTSKAELYIGGVEGVGYYTSIENCMSTGNITNSGPNNYVGSIVGYTTSTTNITNSFWTGDVGYSSSYGYGNPIIDDATSQVAIDSNVLNKLNALSAKHSWNGWILNKNNELVAFTVNNNKGFTLKSQIILLPSLKTIGKLLFEGWYANDDLTTLFTETEIKSATGLYGTYGEKNFTITFDIKGGNPVDPIKSLYSSVVTLQSNLLRDKCSFLFWVNEAKERVSLNFTVPARNVTLTAVWMCTNITSASDFIEFSNNVNIGVTYEGLVVYLDTDVDFSEKSIDIIGKDESNYFQGTFDGQGHIISNLTIDSSSKYTGLFGYSKGLAIKNVVLDESCSISSSYNLDNASVGAMLGYCSAYSGSCVIENIVNMGNVTFNSDDDDEHGLNLGGIVGSLESCSDYESNVKNCASYGSIKHSGTSYYPSIGGIVGYSYSSSPLKRVYIQNCLNYGFITYAGILTDSPHIGGLGGKIYYTDIENCVSAGMISNSGSEDYVGGIAGEVDSYVNISNSFWTSDVRCDKSYGKGNPSIDSATSRVSIDSTLKDMLNDYSKANSLSKWSMLYVNGGKINNISQEYLVVVNKYFPNAEKDNFKFVGWFKDPELNEEYDPKDVTNVIDVYAKYKSISEDSSSIGGGESSSSIKKESSSSIGNTDQSSSSSSVRMESSSSIGSVSSSSSSSSVRRESSSSIYSAGQSSSESSGFANSNSINRDSSSSSSVRKEISSSTSSAEQSSSKNSGFVGSSSSIRSESSSSSSISSEGPSFTSSNSINTESSSSSSSSVRRESSSESIGTSSSSVKRESSIGGGESSSSSSVRRESSSSISSESPGFASSNSINRESYNSSSSSVKRESSSSISNAESSSSESSSSINRVSSSPSSVRRESSSEGVDTSSSSSSVRRESSSSISNSEHSSSSSSSSIGSVEHSSSESPGFVRSSSSISRESSSFSAARKESSSSIDNTGQSSGEGSGFIRTSSSIVSESSSSSSVKRESSSEGVYTSSSSSSVRRESSSERVVASSSSIRRESSSIIDSESQSVSSSFIEGSVNSKSTSSVESSSSSSSSINKDSSSIIDSENPSTSSNKKPGFIYDESSSLSSSSSSIEGSLNSKSTSSAEGPSSSSISRESSSFSAARKESSSSIDNTGQSSGEGSGFIKTSSSIVSESSSSSSVKRESSFGGGESSSSISSEGTSFTNSNSINKESSSSSSINKESSSEGVDAKSSSIRRESSSIIDSGSQSVSSSFVEGSLNSKSTSSVESSSSSSINKESSSIIDSGSPSVSSSSIEGSASSKSTSSVEGSSSSSINKDSSSEGVDAKSSSIRRESSSIIDSESQSTSSNKKPGFIYDESSSLSSSSSSIDGSVNSKSTSSVEGSSSSSINKESSSEGVDAKSSSMRRESSSSSSNSNEGSGFTLSESSSASSGEGSGTSINSGSIETSSSNTIYSEDSFYNFIDNESSEYIISDSLTEGSNSVEKPSSSLTNNEVSSTNSGDSSVHSSINNEDSSSTKKESSSENEDSSFNFNVDESESSSEEYNEKYTTVTFDPMGGHTPETTKKVIYNEKYGKLPTATKIGHTFVGWFTHKIVGNQVTSKTIVKTIDDHTLYAHWTVNKYTITFDFKNGTVIKNTVKYDNYINYPDDDDNYDAITHKNPNLFYVWKPKHRAMPAYNLIVNAQWREATLLAEVFFGSTTMSKSEIVEIVEEYTTAYFVVEKIRRDTFVGRTQVIIRFGNYNELNEFVENVRGDMLSAAKSGKETCFRDVAVVYRNVKP